MRGFPSWVRSPQERLFDVVGCGRGSRSGGREPNRFNERDAPNLVSDVHRAAHRSWSARRTVLLRRQ